MRKSLRHFEDLEHHLPRRRKTSVFVSDSKGKRLREQVSISSPIERSIVWLCRSGLTTREGINWLKTRLRELQTDHGELCVFIFLGTCDFTTKTGDFITLNENHETEREYVLTRYHLLSNFARRKHFEVTFLEIPIFSITEWNRFKGDPVPEVFNNDDKDLRATLEKVNCEIREINRGNGKYSPVFSCDLQRSRKGARQRERYYYDLSLYVDGIHPKPLLAKLWLRRIAVHIKRDCYF